MIEITKKIILSMVFILAVFSIISLSSAIVWERGSLHQHSGYSTHGGYDGSLLTQGDNCFPILLEAHTYGYSVAEMKLEALNLGLDWLGFSDHSYCINSTEFNVVKNDCQNAQSSGFSCLWGEELSAAETVNEIEVAWGCDPTGLTDDGEAHLGAYGIDSFIAQSPVSTHCPSSPDVTQGINFITGQNGFSIANHPYSTLNNFEFLDFESIDAITGETGIEIWNENWDPGWNATGTDDERAKNNWVSKLKSGETVYAYGGTDKHGNPSRINSS